MKTDDLISGTLSLNANTKKIEANLRLKVEEGKNFAYTGHYLVLEYLGYKGLVFCYKNDGGDIDIGTNSSMDANFEFDTPEKWIDQTPIRVMSLNENNLPEFYACVPYFEERMAYFENNDATQYEIEMHALSWNFRNPDKKIIVYNDTLTKQFIDKISKPKLTKQDMIIKLK